MITFEVGKIYLHTRAPLEFVPKFIGKDYAFGVVTNLKTKFSYETILHKNMRYIYWYYDDRSGNICSCTLRVKKKQIGSREVLKVDEVEFIEEIG